MRHKYETRGIVLSRSPAGETNAIIALLTPDFGIVRARAQGARRSGAKLASALTTFAESKLVLVRGMEQWRVVGAVLKENWFLRMRDAAADSSNSVALGPRERAARVCGLLLRLVAGETRDANLFDIVHGFFEALSTLPEEMHEAIEMLAVIRVLAAIGLDVGEIPGEAAMFTPFLLKTVAKERKNYVARINRGIEASGL